GARRAGARVRAGVRPDLHARAPGYAGDHIRRSGGVPGARDPPAPGRPAAALRSAGRARDLGPRQRAAAALRPGRRSPRTVARPPPPSARIEVLGPAEAPLAVSRGRHRWRLLVKAPRDLDLQAYLRAWLARLPKPPADLRLTVDVDPYGFL